MITRQEASRQRRAALELGLDVSTISSRKQAIRDGLNDGHKAAMDVYREEAQKAQDEAQIDNAAPDYSHLVKALESNTQERAWWEFAGMTASCGDVPHRWRKVYEKALCRGAVRQSRSLLKDHEAGLLAVDLGDP